VGVAFGVRRLDFDPDRVGHVTPTAGIDQLISPHRLQLLFMAIRTDEDKIGAVQDS
jgi:hypothetical protein